ncbi:MAG: hypothetical protein ABI619_05360 [Betaproteobacteria bacterium]
MDTHPNGYVLAMVALTALFALRIAGQAIQFVAPQTFLPAFDAFQGSRLSYSVLVLSQLLILAIMVRTCRRTAAGINVPSPRLGRWLAWFGAIYMAGSVGRILVGLAMPAAPAWFSTWIPAFFHVVLAAFVLTAAAYHLHFAPTPALNART